MFERWTDAAREALARAQVLAQEAGQHYVGPDHLLVGIIESDDAEVDAALGNRSGQVMVATLQAMKRRRKPTSGELPVVPLLADLMERARRDAERRQETVGPVQLLRVLVASGERVVTRPIKAAGGSVAAATHEPEPPLPQDLQAVRELTELRDEVVLLRAEVGELRRRLDALG